MVHIETKKALELIKEERDEQLNTWTVDHDDLHVKGELAKAAICFLKEPYLRGKRAVPSLWPFDGGWPADHTDRLHDLVKACALTVAEIERLMRLQQKEGKP